MKRIIPILLLSLCGCWSGDDKPKLSQTQTDYRNIVIWAAWVNASQTNWDVIIEARKPVNHPEGVTNVSVKAIGGSDWVVRSNLFISTEPDSLIFTNSPYTNETWFSILDERIEIYESFFSKPTYAEAGTNLIINSAYRPVVDKVDDGWRITFTPTQQKS